MRIYKDQVNSERLQKIPLAEINEHQNDIVVNCENTVEDEEESFEFNQKIDSKDKEAEDTESNIPNDQFSKYIDSGIGSLVIDKSLKAAEEVAKDFVVSLREINLTRCSKSALIDIVKSQCDIPQQHNLSFPKNDQEEKENISFNKSCNVQIQTGKAN